MSITFRSLFFVTKHKRRRTVVESIRVFVLFKLRLSRIYRLYSFPFFLLQNSNDRSVNVSIIAPKKAANKQATTTPTEPETESKQIQVRI